jgi:SAM-dependent methyltransferase
MAKPGMLVDRRLEEQFAWYEASLPLMERKKRGHFSTPSLLVEQILDACGYTPAADLARARVLDPACGSGNFLAGATRRLLASGARGGLTQEECIMLIQRNLWGFDPDPVSCFLAEMQILSHVGAQFIAPACRGDSEGGRNELRPYERILHIHQADSLVLPWEPCVDLFVANPPYLAAKNNDLSGYRSAQQRGQADSYLLFLSLALQVVRPGGWIGLVLPDPLLARANAARERARLLEEATIHHLWHLAGVFSADVGAVVIVAQKKPPRSLHLVSWVRERWPAASLVVQQHQKVPQALFSRQPGAEFRYLLSQSRGAAFEQMRASLDESPGGDRRFAPLAEFLCVSRGEELGRESSQLTAIVASAADGVISHTQSHYSRGDPRGRAEDGHHDPSTSAYFPVLRGGVDIHAYSTPVAHWQISREAITKPLGRYLSPKLLIVKSTDRLQATLDRQGHVALQTLYLLHLRDAHESVDQLYFFLALLNSRLLRDYVYVLHTAYKWVQPQIEQHVLARLPIPIVGQEQRLRVIERSKALERACSGMERVVEWDERITSMYEEQERAICALYDIATER